MHCLQTIALTILFYSPLSCATSSTAAAPQDDPTEAQAEPQTPNAVHHVTAAGLGAQIQGKAVSEHRREGRVLRFTDPYRDTGEDLVPEPKS